ncbi:MAG: sugar phosphate nucleotidyltransferase [Patescibacteria group bacterium]
MNLKIVILAGGAGSRLWPMSTKKKPKQFQTLVSNKTMLQETYDRVLFVEDENIYVSTNEEYAAEVRKELPQLPAENLILEPSLKDTGPCIGLAAALIAKKDPEAVMAVVYADHLVQNPEEFERALKAAAEIAEKQNLLSIIEVKAKSPNVNLGYVKIGKMLEEVNGMEVFEFKAFKEKPDYETAKKFLSSYNYLWNTGYYVWKVKRILEEFEKHLPKTHEHLKAIQEGGSVNEHYPQCDKISIDYGVMEKVDPKEVRIIPADLEWSDIGTWDALHEELAQKPRDNVSKGKTLILDSEGSIVYNEGDHMIAVLGLKDFVVVNADGCLLVCPKDRSHDLKSIVQKINEQNES